MTDDRKEELAALSAFGLLDENEAKEFAAAVAADPGLRERADRLRGTAAALAHTAPVAEPPAALRARLMAEIGNRSPSAAAAAHPPAAERPSARAIAFPGWIPWAVAACFAIAAGWLGALYLTATTTNAVLNDRAALVEISLKNALNQVEQQHILSERQLADLRTTAQEMKDLRAQLALDRSHVTKMSLALADSDRTVADLNRRLKSEGDLARFKIATLTSMLGRSPTAVAVALWDPSQQKGVLEVARLPAATSDQDYQLWVIDPQYASPVSAGVFTVDPGTGKARYAFRASEPIRSGKFAVSLERKGGGPKPEGPIVLMSD